MNIAFLNHSCSKPLRVETYSMHTKFICSAIAACGLLGSVGAQESRIPPALNPRNYPNGTAFLQESELVVRAADISAFDILDTTEFTVSYRFTNPDYVKGYEGCSETERMILEIGKTRTAFYSRDLFALDSLITFTCILHGENPNLATNNIRFCIFGDRIGHCFEIIQRLPFQSGVAACIHDETMPRWTIDSLQCRLLGFSCFRARTRYNGRDWVAWFTPEIPVAAGPWKLWGLPGLVLQAEDSEHLFAFTCDGITRQRVPIKKYAWKYRPMTRRAWLKLERRMHESPFDFFAKNTMIFKLGKRASLVDQTWTTPYNPIERE